MHVCNQDHTLDGELFLGRKQFNETTSIVRTQDFHDQRWTLLKFMVFDIPSLGHKPFEERVAFLHQNFAGYVAMPLTSTNCSHGI